MNEDRFDELIRDAARTYRRPGEEGPPLEEMWRVIERDAFDVAAPGGAAYRRFGARLWRSQLARLAAALLLGIGVGRAWTTYRMRGAVASAPASTAAAARPVAPSEPYDLATTEYLGETAALLIALPSEAHGSSTDRRFLSRAGDLLLTTRLLLDSPAAADPSLRNLLEDLELVLAQIVRLPDDRGRGELELINQAMEQREVLLRLRSAVADMSADD